MGEVNIKRLLVQRNMMNLRFPKHCRSSIISITVLILALFQVGNVHGFSHGRMDRSRFMKHAISKIIAVSSITSMVSSPSNAIEFVPASPYFSGTYKDALEIIYAQRVAVDNIANVIEEGNLEEAGFKAMQLSAQIRLAGKIILETFQENIAGKSDSVILLRFLSCQRKFALLLDLCDDCEDSLQTALRSKSGAAVAEMKSLSIVEETKSSYDDFLADLKTFEKAIEK